jgi:hypothetical protein
VGGDHGRPTAWRSAAIISRFWIELGAVTCTIPARSSRSRRKRTARRKSSTWIQLIHCSPVLISLFEAHLAPADWQRGLDSDEARELARTLARLQSTARQALAAALDASVARIGRERLGELIEP